MNIRRWIPFVDTNPYNTVRQHVFAKLKKETKGIGGGTMTAQELESKLPYGIQTVSARLKELRENGDAFFQYKRECEDMDHNREVNAYRASYFSTVDDVGGAEA